MSADPLRSSERRWPLIPGAIRYEAEWIAKQHADESGEWNPDRDEYAGSYHNTKDEAERAAVKGSKASGIEWILVAEQKVVGYEWVDQRRWTGDYDGLHEETYNVEQADD